LQAAKVLDDVNIAAHTPILLDRAREAEAMVAAIPVLPVTSGFLALSPCPSSEAVKARVAEAMGTLLLSPPTPAPHVHTPHCSHAAPVFPYNHAPAPAGEVLAAAEAGDAARIKTLLLAGGSTEETNGVRMVCVDYSDGCLCTCSNIRHMLSPCVAPFL